jgi:hypothetical protein
MGSVIRSRAGSLAGRLSSTPVLSLGAFGIYRKEGKAAPYDYATRIPKQVRDDMEQALRRSQEKFLT